MDKLFDVFPQELKELVIEDKIKNFKSKKISKSNRLGNIEFAFSKLKKLPLQSRRNVISAIDHFFNVKNVTDHDREIAFKKIIEKSKAYEICTMVFSSKYQEYLQNIKNSKESIIKN